MKWCTPPLPSSIIRRQNVSVSKSRLENLVEHIKKLQRSNYQNWDYYFVQMQMIYMRCLNTMILSLFLDPPKSIRKNQFCHDTIHIINSQYVLTSCTKCLPQFSAYQKYQQWKWSHRCISAEFTMSLTTTTYVKWNTKTCHKFTSLHII